MNDDEPRANSPEDLGWNRQSCTPPPVRLPPPGKYTTKPKEEPTMAKGTGQQQEMEGARDFSMFLRHIDDGVLHADASKELHELAEKLHKYVDLHGGVAKGTLILTVNLSALANGTVDVVADLKTKEPKPKRARSVFWLTPGNNLSPENPRQQKLQLREVPGKTEAPRDLAPEVRPTRSV